MRTYESVFVENHDFNSLSETVASSLLRAQVRVGRAIGDMHRETLIAHADLSRALTIERTTRAMPVKANEEKTDASSTKALTPVF